MKNKKNISVYVHIPFCVKKCDYCDFLSLLGADDLIGDYFDALLKEIDSSLPVFSGRVIDTLYFGGGTPSCVPAQYPVKVTDKLRNLIGFSDDPEITIEINPKTADEEKIGCYLDCGINRFSIGMQSGEDTELKALGRVHDNSDFMHTWELLKGRGAGNINVDVMTGIPHQSFESAKSTLKKVCGLKPEHISVYSLIIEPGTPFFKRGREALDLPDEDTEMRIYEYTREYLGENGYERYEISNYALKGKECRHNKVYWDCADYIAFGAGASSRIGNRRFTNTKDIRDYIKNPVYNLSEDLLLSREDEMGEFIFMGLRKTNGISTEDFEERFGTGIFEIYKEPIEKYERQGLLLRRNGRLYLSERGLDVSNVILADFI